MPVFVLLSFDDDDEAKEFVKAQLNERVQVTYNDDQYDPFEVSAEVRGVYKRPVQFCTCTRTPGWTRGKRFGWWVCVDCGKPSKMWAMGVMLFTPLGTNLLPREIVPDPYNQLPSNPNGQRSPEEWLFLIENMTPDESENPTC